MRSATVTYTEKNQSASKINKIKHVQSTTHMAKEECGVRMDQTMPRRIRQVEKKADDRADTRITKKRKMPYGITQCYLPPNAGERAPP